MGREWADVETDLKRRRPSRGRLMPRVWVPSLPEESNNTPGTM